MRNYLAAAAIGCALGLAGCATATSSDQARAGTPAPDAGEQKVVTGSNLDDRPAQDRMVRSVGSQSYKESKSSVIGSQPKGN